MKALGWIITFVISIITVVVLELNKNTLLGWVLFGLAFAGIVVISRKCIGAWSWWRRGLFLWKGGIV